MAEIPGANGAANGSLVKHRITKLSNISFGPGNPHAAPPHLQKKVPPPCVRNRATYVRSLPVLALKDMLLSEEAHTYVQIAKTMILMTHDSRNP